MSFAKLFTTFKTTCPFTLLGLGKAGEWRRLVYIRTVVSSGGTVDLVRTTVPGDLRTTPSRADWERRLSFTKFFQHLKRPVPSHCLVWSSLSLLADTDATKTNTRRNLMLDSLAETD